MKYRRLTQAELAADEGLSERTYYRYLWLLKQRHLPNIFEVNKFCELKYLVCSIGFLYRVAKALIASEGQGDAFIEAYEGIERRLRRRGLEADPERINHYLRYFP